MTEGGAFADVSYEQWRTAAEAVAPDGSLESLGSELSDGIATLPLYTPHLHSTADDPAGLAGSYPFIRGASCNTNRGGWEIRQTHDIQRSNARHAITVEVSSGVDGVTVAEGWKPSTDSETLRTAIGDAVTAGASMHLAPGATPAHADALLAVLNDAGANPATVTSWLGVSLPTQQTASWAAQVREAWPASVPLCVDSTDVAADDATYTAEIAATLSTGAKWLTSMGRVGVSPSDAAAMIGMTITASADVFPTIAKLRALRQCWAWVLETFDTQLDGELPMRLHVVTASSMFSTEEPSDNILRATTACFAAIIGGADAITVLPFDMTVRDVWPDGAADALGPRTAVNTQLILRDESHLADVADAGGGSWYLESLTAAMAEAAWGKFQYLQTDEEVSQ